MKKLIFITAASLFVIGQAVAQGQAPANQPANQQKIQSEQTKKANAPRGKTASSKKMRHHVNMKRSAHRVAKHHHSRHAMRHAKKQQTGFGPNGWNQQQSWNWGWNQNQHQGRHTSKQSQMFGWHSSGPCKNNKRRDGSWCW